jgi:putative PIN family toxin of toxin-antitoxin system
VISATLDSSVLVRALNFGGPAAILLGHIKAGNIRMDISDAIINETIGILRDKFKQDPYTVNDNSQKLRALGNLVKPTETLNVITEDPPDNRILECAQAARSDYIVSEDKDLLRRGQFGGAPIVTIRDFFDVAVNRGRRM